MMPFPKIEVEDIIDTQLRLNCSTEFRDYKFREFDVKFLEKYKRMKIIFNPEHQEFSYIREIPLAKEQFGVPISISTLKWMRLDTIEKRRRWDKFSVPKSSLFSKLNYRSPGAKYLKKPTLDLYTNMEKLKLKNIWHVVEKKS
jgi:hypothetical protein